MSNVLGHNCEYFQLPKVLLRDEVLPDMSGSELKLYVCLLYYVQRNTTDTFNFKDAQLRNATGLSPNSLRTARKELESRGYLICERGLGNAYTYKVLNPETSEPLINLFHRQKTSSATTSRSRNSESERAAKSVSLISKLSTEQYRMYFETRLGQRIVRISGNTATALCPFHKDTEPSLRLDFQKGRWYCHGSCKSGSGLIEFEKKLLGCGLKTAYLNVSIVVGEPTIAQDSIRNPEAVYEYVDEEGELLFQVVRLRGKQFLQRRPHPQGPGWVDNLDGVRRVLYRLPEIVAADEVYITEGEKDAERLRSVLAGVGRLGSSAATTCANGARGWRDEYSSVLKGKSVTIVPDRDDAGQLHAEQVALSLYNQACCVRVAQLPELNGVKDVSDFLDDHEGGDLVAILDAAPKMQPTHEIDVLDEANFDIQNRTI